MQSSLRTMLRAKASLKPLRLSAFPTSQAFRAGVMHSRNLHIKKYTAEHEVVNFDDATGVGVVSITDHAQSVLGDVVFVELPQVGTSFTQGDQLGAVESVKAASDIYAPVSGTVEEINEALSGQPGLLNKSPEDKDRMACQNQTFRSLEKLMTHDEYKQTYEN
ncbi:hypothetical protein CVT25_010209 [Psilocybe cyanescens]|uniref:Glycine cleavage system H protein n=1 Tax=Psilocybe cyanescens TaxID=93625 RepID=A0A409XCX7_PSICY|nr:hypothetical protein CVT25_010209 [Psilocybe cyanescens]